MRKATFACLAIALTAGCTEPTSHQGDFPVRYGKPAASTSPTVKSTSPSSSVRGVTLDVRVLGSGFDAGSRAQWAIKGVASNKVVTNSTRYVNSGEVVANITISSDADVTLYDVIVTTASGKPGIGTESFEVVLEEVSLPTAGGASGGAMAINDQGVIVGLSTDRNGDRTGLTYPVKWTLAGGKWTITKLSSVASKDGIAYGINNSNVIVGMSNERATVWKPDGSVVDFGPGCATAINNNGVIVGTIETPGGHQGVAWTPNGTGWNPPQIIPDALIPSNYGGIGVCVYAWLSSINNAGVIAGTALRPGDTPAKWTAQTPYGPWNTATLLAPAGNGNGINGSGWGINEAGDIMGTLYVPEKGGVAPHLWMASGAQVHYGDYGSEAGMGRGINDSPMPDVVARAYNNNVPVGIFGGSVAITRLSRWGGLKSYSGAMDVNNAVGGQPLRIVGSVGSTPTVWTYR